MDRSALEKLLVDFKQEKVSLAEALGRLRNFPYEDLGIAKLDHHRRLRQGFPEVVFGQGKQPDHVVQIVERLLQSDHNLLVTRTTEDVFQRIQRLEPRAEYHAAARAILVRKDTAILGRAVLPIITAGTSDIAVAEEAVLTAEAMGNQVERIYDVGVAGLHRLLDNRANFCDASVAIVVAGMEGALPSVVGGLVPFPVIAVPTSVGYGASFGGIAALLGMLNTCASNVAVVNIDNGFGAACVASLINRKISQG